MLKNVLYMRVTIEIVLICENYAVSFCEIKDLPMREASSRSRTFLLVHTKYKAWHEVLGNLEKEIDVQVGKPVQVNFEIPNE